MKVKPDQITRAIRIAKAISEKIDPAFARVDMGVDEDSPVARRMGMLTDIRPAKPYTPSVRHFAAGGDVDDDYSTPDPLGLYSHAAATAANLPQAKGTPDQYRGMLLNKGVKPAELEWSGFEGAFSGQPQVSREDVARHFFTNMPRISEKVLREEPDPDELSELERRHKEENAAHWQMRQEQKASGDVDYEALDREHKRMLRRQRLERDELMLGHESPYHGEFTIPGGKNYREILLKHAGDASFPGVGQHFGGEPDILTSLRMKDRTDHEGDKVLHLDELQSDWGQQGRDVGFAEGDGDKRDARNALNAYIQDLSERSGANVGHDWPYAAWNAVERLGEPPERLRDLMNAATIERRDAGRRIERAPYVTKTDDWVDLGLKRALVEAARGGYDKLAWTPGSEHVDRYSLDKHVSRIHHGNNGDGTYGISVVGKNGLTIHESASETPENLARLLGKEVADKIVSGEGENSSDTNRQHVENMKAFRELERRIPAEWVQHKIDLLNSRNPGQEIEPDILTMIRDMAEVKKHEDMADQIGLGEQYRDLYRRYADSWNVTRSLPEGPEGYWHSLGGLDLKVGGGGMRKFYDEMLPKRLMRLAKQHDPDTQFARSIIDHPTDSGIRDDWGLSDEFQDKDTKELPAIRITPKMRESILKKGFAAYASGGEVEGDDHPLTQDVYHGIKGEGVGPALGQAIGHQMFVPEHPGDVAFKPNATALMLGPHVARDPTIAGDFRFTTGEQMIHGDDGLRRHPDKPQGQVKMLRTFPDEKFFPVSQPSTQSNDFEEHGNVAPHDYDDRAVHRLVMSTVFSRHPDLFMKAVEDAYGEDPQRFFKRNEMSDLSPESIDKFFRYNNMPLKRPLHQEIIKRFRNIMRDQGYAGLSYINTDEDETRKESDAPVYGSRPAEDKKCYIVFPQRDKETGWSPLRNRYAKFDPTRKGRPGLHEASGGSVNGYADGGMPEDPMQSIARTENAPGVTVSPRPGKMGGYPVRMGTMDDHEPWSFTTPEGEEMPSPPPIQHPVFNEPRLDRLHKATAPIFKSKGFNDLVEDITGLRGLTIKPIIGTWKGEAEPSFHISHPDMTAEHVQKLAPLLGFGFQQDAVVHHHHNPDPENEGFPTAYIGKSGKMTKRDLDKVIEAAKREGIDFSQTSDGRGVKFSHFGDDGEEFKEFGNAVARVADAVKFPHRHYVRSSGDLQNAQDYLTGIFGSGEGAHGESGLYGSSARSPDLFGRIVDHVLAPYAKAVASEGYRLSPERLADTYGLSPEETEKVRSALLPSRGDRTTIPLMEGREQLDIRPTGNRGKPTVGDVLFALQNRAASKGQVDPGDYSDKASNKIASDIADEVKYHIDTAGKSAIGWYDSALKKAMRKYNVIFPELKSDAEKQTMFKAILGITSQGQDVFANSSHTAKLYSLIRDGMELPDAVKRLRGTFGDKTRAIEFNLNKLHELATNVGGYSNLHDILGKTKTVSQWNKILRENPDLNSGGKPLQMSGGKDQKVTGWMAFGPKIGSFINNLHGDFSTLTADLWFSRTWNRLLGHNFIHTPAAEAKQYRDFRDALIAEHAARNPDQALAEASPHKTSNGVIKTDANGNPEPWLHGNDVAGMDRDQFDSLVNDPDRMLSYATEIENRYRKGQYKQKSDVRRRAKNWIENRELPVAAPRSDLEREFQQNTIEKAQKQLKRKGLDISVADIQAALWFHEKDLFRRLGVASEKAAPADYSDAASRTIRQMRPKMAVKALKTGGAAIDRAILISMRASKKR